MRINYLLSLEETISSLMPLYDEDKLMKVVFEDWTPICEFSNFLSTELLLRHYGVLDFHTKLEKIKKKMGQIRCNDPSRESNHLNLSELQLDRALENLKNLYFSKYESCADAICPKCNHIIMRKDLFARLPEYDCKKCDYKETEDKYIYY